MNTFLTGCNAVIRPYVAGPWLMIFLSFVIIFKIISTEL